MRELTVKIGPVTTIHDRSYTKNGKMINSESENYANIGQLEVDEDKKVVWMLYLTCDAKIVVKCLKDDPLFNQEEVNLKVYGFMPEQDKAVDEFYTKIYEFKGTIYDALLISANEGAKYDRA